MSATPNTSASPTTVDLLIDAEDAQLLMAALGELPFKRVFELIGALNHQANVAGPGAPLVCALNVPAFALMVEALGHLPYHRVHALIDNLKSQLQSARPAFDVAPTQRRSRTPAERVQ